MAIGEGSRHSRPDFAGRKPSAELAKDAMRPVGARAAVVLPTEEMALIRSPGERVEPDTSLALIRSSPCGPTAAPLTIVAFT